MESMTSLAFLGVFFCAARARLRGHLIRFPFTPIPVSHLLQIPACGMPLSEASLQWLLPVAPRQQEELEKATPLATPVGDENVDPKNPIVTPKKRSRHVSSVVDVDEMVSSGFVCCVKRCVDAFVNGEGDVKTLRAEQRIMSRLTGAGRSAFVHTMIPLIDPGHRVGAMRAGDRLVCTAFFRKAFHVSNNMIQARKPNPGSPALKS